MKNEDDKEPTNIVDSQKMLDAYLHAKSGTDEEEDPITREIYETELHTLNIDAQVLTSEGNATFTKDDDVFGLHHFNFSLGPRNSLRLIEFMFKLPPEPDEDDDAN